MTTESNPDSVTMWDLDALRAGGFTRISFGMQSAVAARAGHPGPLPRPAPGAGGGRVGAGAGFDQVSLDLIYGTPGESLADWETSLESALACAPDHVSAYALIVEEGTALARQVRRGEVAMTDDDDLADKYLAADAAMSAAGLGWYEVSNWATGPDARCRHNVGYWNGDNWWGVGPGRALARRRGAVVERQAPGRLDRADRRGGEPRARPRDARRARPGGWSGCCSRCGCAPGCRSTCSTPPAAPPCPAWRRTGW